MHWFESACSAPVFALLSLLYFLLSCFLFAYVCAYLLSCLWFATLIPICAQIVCFALELAQFEGNQKHCRAHYSCHARFSRLFLVQGKFRLRFIYSWTTISWALLWARKIFNAKRDDRLTRMLRICFVSWNYKKDRIGLFLLYSWNIGRFSLCKVHFSKISKTILLNEFSIEKVLTEKRFFLFELALALSF